ncbi:hypothetical protein BRD56_02815 [Thermoplasmatales archaeon SW_10_69_26]|nr:MAG: hypothetical protein BRD56_02815 [Thermoplasmatales archaeon SW_10_69_26]
MAIVLVSAALIPALAAGPWLPSSHAADSSASTTGQLRQAADAMQTADDHLAADDLDQARQALETSGHHLDEAEATFAREQAALEPRSREALATALALAREAHDLRDAEADWRASLGEHQTAQAETDTVSARGQALAEVNATLAEGEALVQARADLRDRTSTFAHRHPGLAERSGVQPDQAPPTDRLERFREEQRSRLLAATIDVAFTPKSDPQRDAMSPEARQLVDEHAPPRLLERFASFDEDEDGELDQAEAVAFYEWVETEIGYRYDDENATPEVPAAVGDGREGTDDQQRPIETLDEGLGDCEDTSVLQVAFHRYWGSRAYLALLNTEPGGGIAHAAAIVAVGGPGDVAPAEEGFRTYTFAEGNEHGIEPGTYAIVDNTYSDRFGTITGGVEEGAFEIQAVETLTQALEDS